MPRDTKLESGEPALMQSVQPNHPIANLTLGALATISNPFRLYQHHVNGASVEKIAQTFNLPESWVEQRIEAVRLCVEHQLTFAFEL